MCTLKDNDVVLEIKCGNNFEYLLKDSTHFINTEYKVLQSQDNDVFVKCMKMTRNGLIDLFYMTDEYRSLSSMLIGINADTLVNIVINLMGCVIEVRNNGFLSCLGIDVSWDKIFIEQNTLKVKLVYLPLSVRLFDSYPEFENELRSSLIKLMNNVITVTNNRVVQFIQDLCNGTMSIEDIYNKSRSIPALPLVEDETIAESKNEREIKLVAINAPSYFEILIDSKEILIGKKQELVNRVIPFNKMISRKHCRISNINGAYYINDEGSANGTFVNGKRINVGQNARINRGDVIRLADSDFQVV